MKKGKIGVVGDGDSILIFKAVGMHIFPVTSVQEAEDTVKKLAREYSVIYITDDYAVKLDQFLKRYISRPYPIVIPIPSTSGSNGYAINKIHENVEKAVGMNILIDDNN